MIGGDVTSFDKFKEVNEIEKRISSIRKGFLSEFKENDAQTDWICDCRERERERGCCDREKEERRMRSQKEGEIEVMWRRRKLTKIITATT